MGCKKRFHWLLPVVTVCCAQLLAARAGAVTFPVFSYSDPPREWEARWVGTQVDHTNVEGVREYVHPAVYAAVRNPQLFGAERIWFEIVPYRPYDPSAGMRAATATYAPTARLDQNGNLEGYGAVAGIPFPQPSSALEMVWNFDGNTKGDAHHLLHTGTVVDCRTRLERGAEHLRWDMRWVGRYDVPPLPAFSPAENPRGIARSYFQRHLAPADFIDTTILELKYQDFDRPTDLWIYTATFRRIRRYATNQRTDTIDGTDMIYDDQDGWYTHLGHNTYTYLGRKDLLVARHQQPDRLERVKGQGFWSGIQRERVNHWVVEAVNREKRYLYGKQVWYLDPETWQMNFKVMYNRQGERWKMYEFFHAPHPSADNGTTPVPNGEQIVDFIRQHGSPARQEMRGVGIVIDRELFTTRSLRKKTY